MQRQTICSFDQVIDYLLEKPMLPFYLCCIISKIEFGQESESNPLQFRSQTKRNK